MDERPNQINTGGAEAEGWNLQIAAQLFWPTLYQPLTDEVRRHNYLGQPTAVYIIMHEPP